MVIKNKLYIDIKGWLWIATGVLITMPVFVLPVGELALYNIPFMGAILYQCIASRGKAYFYPYKTPLYLFIGIMLVSSIFSKYIVPAEWYATSIRAALKLSLVFIVFLIIYSDKELICCREKFTKGLLLSVPIQFGWIILQFLSWHFMHIKLNKVLFGVTVYMESTNDITLTGLSWERADTALLFAFSTALSKNKYIRLMALIGTLMTASRSGLLLLVIVYGYEFAVNFRKCIKKSKIKTKTIKRIVLVIILIPVLALILKNVHIAAVDIIFNKLEQIAARTIGTITDKSIYNTKTVDPHKLYYIWLPDTLRHSSFLQLLIGSGTRISGWMYTQIYNRFPLAFGPWNVECDFIALILGNGFIGFIFYYASLLTAFVTSKSERFKKVVLLVFFGSFLYQLFTSTLCFLIFVFSLNICKESLYPEIAKIIGTGTVRKTNG